MFETDVLFIGLGGLTQSKHIRGITKVDSFKDKVREAKQRGVRHVQNRDSECTKDVDAGVARQEEKRRATEKV